MLTKKEGHCDLLFFKFAAINTVDVQIISTFIQHTFFFNIHIRN